MGFSNSHLKAGRYPATRAINVRPTVEEVMGAGEDEAQPSQVALDERKLFPGEGRRDGRQGGDPEDNCKEEGDDPYDGNGLHDSANLKHGEEADLPVVRKHSPRHFMAALLQIVTWVVPVTFVRFPSTTRPTGITIVSGGSKATDCVLGLNTAILMQAWGIKLLNGFKTWNPKV